MKSKILLGVVLGAAISCSAYFGFMHNNIGKFRLEHASEEEENEGGIGKAMRAKEASERRFEKLKDENGNFYSSYYQQAVQQANQMAASGNRAGLGLQWDELGPDNVGGRTRAILVDRRDVSHNTIYAGGVGGGMWKSTNRGNTWTKLNWPESNAIACIDQGLDGTIYIGTGEGLAQIGGSSLNSGTMGNGIYTLDANDQPVQMTSTATFSASGIDPNSPWAAVNRIACNPTNPDELFAATQGGLKRTIDRGVNWTDVTVPGIPGGSSAADIKWHKDGLNIFAVVGGNNDLIRSLNGGVSFERVLNSTNPGFPAGQGRMEVAVAPSDANTAYVSIATTSGATYGVFRTVDAGATWTTIGLKGALFDPFGSNNQGWYDNVIAVSPTDPNKVYLGGVDFYTWSNLSGWKLADAGLGSGEVNPYYIHPDKHAITLDPTNPDIMYVGCDGGVYRSDNALSAFPFPTHQVKNRGYNVTQFYSVAAALTGEVMGGTQDNGTQFIDRLGNTSATAESVFGGDGIYTDISHIDPRIFFAGIYFGQAMRSGNYGSSFDAFFDIKIDPQGHTQPSRCGAPQDQNAPFITPFQLCETKTATTGIKTVSRAADRDYAVGEQIEMESKVAKYKFNHTLTSAVNSGDTVTVLDPIKSRFFLTSNCGVFVTPDALDLSIIPRWYKLMNGMIGLANCYAQSTDGNILYVGTNAGRVYRFDNLNAKLDTTVYPTGNVVPVVYPIQAVTNWTVASGRSIEGISVDPNDPDHVAVAIAGFSNSNAPHVYERTAASGNTWNPLSTGLPNMPCYDIVISQHAGHIIVGSELGLWSWDGTTWNEENGGIGRVAVYRLREQELFENTCGTLYIGTHGRGLWRSTTLLNPACKTNVGIKEVTEDKTAITNLNLYPNPVSTNTTISLTLDYPGDVTLRVIDMPGRLVKELTFRKAAAGENKFELDASNLPAGNYIVAATVDGKRTQSKIMVVTK
jgi:hypothetical protein